MTRDIPIQTSVASAQRLNGLYSPRGFQSEGHASTSLRVKRPKRETDHKSSFDVDIMNSFR